VNDLLGHLAGDAPLRAVSDRTRPVLRKDDVLARLGGDEVAVLLPELSDKKAAEIVRLIVNLLARPFLLSGGMAHVGIRVGCARAPRDAAVTGLPRMAVNVSAAQRAAGGLVQQVTAALSSSGTHPRHIELEVTETALLRPGADTMDQLRALQAMGIEIALDDFGTGYSSLSLLREFPFDRMKLDRSFLPRDARSRAILSAASQLAHGLGMRTTAEGIETAEQLDRVRQLGCTDVQGFLTGRPVPASAWVATSITFASTLPQSPREGEA
jgi:predicted signal transduction protein with EAL and GGDEF domain